MTRTVQLTEEKQLDLIIDLLQKEKAYIQEGLDYEPKILKWENVNQENCTREEFEELQVEIQKMMRENRKNLEEKMKTIVATLKIVMPQLILLLEDLQEMPIRLSATGEPEPI